MAIYTGDLYDNQILFMEVERIKWWNDTGIIFHLIWLSFVVVYVCVCSWIDFRFEHYAWNGSACASFNVLINIACVYMEKDFWSIELILIFFSPLLFVVIHSDWHWGRLRRSFFEWWKVENSREQHYKVIAILNSKNFIRNSFVWIVCVIVKWIFCCSLISKPK